jgi:hypothetical protein
MLLQHLIQNEPWALQICGSRLVPRDGKDETAVRPAASRSTAAAAVHIAGAVFQDGDEGEDTSNNVVR